MPQVSLKHPIADKFIEFVEKNLAGRDPDTVIGEFIVEGLELIVKERPYIKRVPNIERQYGNLPARTIYYKEIATIDVNFNTIKLLSDIRTKREALREAIVLFCIKRGIIPDNKSAKIRNIANDT